MGQLREELPQGAVTDELIRLLSDDAVADEVLEAIKRAQLPEDERTEVQRQADTLFHDLSEIRVIEIKRFLLDLADDVGSGVTTIFAMFGLFSIMVGILLIFLIFVMLAAARRTEMGMTRAVGAKRSHLVQMFVFEGTAYDLAAAAVGTAIGLLVSLGLVAVFNYLLGKFDDDFRFTYHLEARSAIVAFCAGMIIVFATAAVSAYRVSRMNIAEAVRGLPESVSLSGEAPFVRRLLLMGKAIVQPYIFVMLAVAPRARPMILYGYLMMVWIGLPIVWLVDIVIAVIFKILGRRHPWWNNPITAIFRPFVFGWRAFRPHFRREVIVNQLLAIIWIVVWLPDILVAMIAVIFARRRPWWKTIGAAVLRPFIFQSRSFQALYGPVSVFRFIGYNLLADIWAPLLPVWWVGVGVALVRFAWPYLRRGWLTFLLGLPLVYVGVRIWDLVAPFAIGSSLIILGLGLMLRLLVLRVPRLSEVFEVLVLVSGLILLSHGIVKGELLPVLIGLVVAGIGVSMTVPLLLKWTDRRPEVIDRLAFTFIGVVMLAYWMLPFDTMEPITGVLEDDIEMFFLSGMVMVTASVWVVMYNADLLLKAITGLTSRIGKLRPVLVTAVAYPMSAKFRTGLTLAMFALVIFTMIVMSLLNDAFSNTFDDPDRVLGEWDIGGRVSFTNPIGDMRAAIEDKPKLSLDDFEAIGGYVWAEVQMRQPDASNQLWERYVVRAATDEYLEASRYDFKIIAEGYGDTKEDVWNALRRDPTLAVIDASATEGADDDFGDAGPFKMEGVSIKDKKMVPIEIDVLEPLSGKQLQFTIIGVLDSAAAAHGIITSKSSIDKAFDFPVPLNTYRFRMAEGVDVKAVSKDLEAAFLENGMETEVLEERLADVVSFINSFYNLLTGYMGLGLVVGIAGLGVISMRAVVERRQQIGVLRAIGYRRRMIQLSFLLESSFIALLGVAIGVILGTIISINLVDDLGDELEGLRFTIPWIQIIIIIAVTYIFSMITTYLPAHQASRIYPAEALRYE